MRKIALLSSALLFGLLATYCSKNPIAPRENEPPRAMTVQEIQLIESDNNFGLKLFTAVSAAEGNKNVIISPLSISMALGMTLNGADGETYAAMRETLELNGLSESEINQSYKSLISLLTHLDYMVVFQIANSIWYRDTFPIAPTFININKEYFDAEVHGIDFNHADAADIINQWVNEKTNGKIDKIVVKPISPDTVMFLLNAIYFKGDWTYRFDKAKTSDESFNLLDGSIKQVPMMKIEDVSFPYYANEDFQAIELSYGDSLYCMTIILPRLNKDLDSVIESLDGQTWDNLTSHYNDAKLDGFEMPKFKLEYEIGLNGVLKSLGMEVAFDSFNANFSRMRAAEVSVPDTLYISNVKHKTFIEVNEEGTEAAAVTSVVEITEALGAFPDFIVRIDRPFIFAIRDRHSGTILFIGKILDPTA